MRKIEYRNEYGVMFEIINGVRRVYQDVAPGSYTWTNTWLNGKLVGCIEMKTGKLVLNALPKAIPVEVDSKLNLSA